MERVLRKKYIAGVDEAGCGALAGPVIAGAVILLSSLKEIPLLDSKSLSPQRREKYFKIIKKFAITAAGLATEKEIDQFGLTKARGLAVKRALKNLDQKPSFVLIDGRRFIDDLEYPHRFIVRGDQKIKSIACASIIAKVTRDSILVKLSKRYPQYNFEKNKGYGTKEHFQALKKYGPCKIHRRLYQPVKRVLKNNKLPPLD